MKVSNKKNSVKSLVFILLGIIIINIVGSHFFKRFDLTQDKRYTLSETSLQIINEIDTPLYIDVFLEGNFPAEFKRLQTETRQILEEFKAYNKNIVFQFVNPLENEEDSDAILQSFYERGLTPINMTLDHKGKQTQELLFPWAIATYNDKSARIPLLKNMMGTSTEEKVIHSVQNLEYAFSDAFNTVIKNKEKKIAVIKGNGELEDRYLGDLLKQIRENYFIAPFTLDSIAKNPVKTLQQLQEYDLALIAKPTERFSDEEKQVLDQYIINGGKTIWMIDAVIIEMDSLYNETGSTLAYPRDLNLNDMFFKYGVRINHNIIKDIMATPILLETGTQGSQTQRDQYAWFYSPLIYPNGKHPIVNNLDGLRFEFVNSIDTLKNNIRKTILLSSSPYSRAIGTPVEVSLKMVAERPAPEEFINKGNIPVAVLLEGSFQSVFQNRILSFKDNNFKDKGIENKMIIISDGDIIKNQLDNNNQPIELGYDKWTNKLYANKEFLLNSINYLLDDNGLINIRSKKISLPILDKERVYSNYTTIQFITIGLPLIIVLVFGILFTYIRKKRFGH